MGFKLQVGSETFNLVSFSSTEASTPLSATDSSGQVGTINLSVQSPDPFVEGRNETTRRYSPLHLMNKSVRLTDTRKGFTLGKVVGVQNPSGGIFTLRCTSRLGELNVFNVQAQPFVGTLEQAFRNYVALAGITADVFVDPTISATPVVFPGWNGELWFHLKQMAASLDVDISLVSGITLLRPIRAREAIRGRDVDRTQEIGGSLAQFVELYHYNNRAITNELVYPPGGWTEEVTIINVNAGEYVEQELQLSASVSSIQQPVMQTFVSREHNSSSVYTVVGDDGLPITPSAWSSRGGSLSVEINPDTTSLKVKIQAPHGLPNKDGNEIQTYGIALSAESTAGRYSTLRIIGSGVAYNRELFRIATGVPPSQTGTEVGATVDNPYFGSLAQLYRAGSWAARQYSGRAFSISGSVIAVNKLGDSGVATYPPYSVDQANHSSRTYAQVQTLYAGKSYETIQAEIFASVQNDFENQVFGNVNGARVWDKTTHRWYRIREATLNADTIQFSADDDLTHGDVYLANQGRTYRDYQAFYGNMSYEQADLIGLHKIPDAPPSSLLPGSGVIPSPSLLPKF